MLPWNFPREGARRGQEDVARNVWWMYIPFRDGETIDLIICDMKCHPKVMFCGPLTSVRAGCFGEEWSCWMPLIPPALSVNAAGAPGDQPRGERCPIAQLSTWPWQVALKFPKGTGELLCSRGGCCAGRCAWWCFVLLVLTVWCLVNVKMGASWVFVISMGMKG